MFFSIAKTCNETEMHLISIIAFSAQQESSVANVITHFQYVKVKWTLLFVLRVKWECGAKAVPWWLSNFTQSSLGVTVGQLLCQRGLMGMETPERKNKMNEENFLRNVSLFDSISTEHLKMYKRCRRWAQQGLLCREKSSFEKRVLVLLHALLAFLTMTVSSINTWHTYIAQIGWAMNTNSCILHFVVHCVMIYSKNILIWPQCVVWCK